MCFIFVAFQTEGKLYLILEFLRGGDLFTRLSKEASEIKKKTLSFVNSFELFLWRFLLPRWPPLPILL